ncbi:Hypothetical protein CAP_2828 [Chondromyces apiculatus DSM 436]|uniref:Uncharacterized protein n=1 Tax=Chondromyces apiculatus DSM 436 TaxID=1192034 RepID=A0A017TA70_9BACT|nr:Hypothetical protein CAP_2828 [Chondromyces apiculatus DSM 436]
MKLEDPHGRRRVTRCRGPVFHRWTPASMPGRGGVQASDRRA